MRWAMQIRNQLSRNFLAYFGKWKRFVCCQKISKNFARNILIYIYVHESIDIWINRIFKKWTLLFSNNRWINVLRVQFRPLFTKAFREVVMTIFVRIFARIAELDRHYIPYIRHPIFRCVAKKKLLNRFSLIFNYFFDSNFVKYYKYIPLITFHNFT